MIESVLIYLLGLVIIGEELERDYRFKSIRFKALIVLLWPLLLLAGVYEYLYEIVTGKKYD